MKKPYHGSSGVWSMSFHLAFFEIALSQSDLCLPLWEYSNGLSSQFAAFPKQRHLEKKYYQQEQQLPLLAVDLVVGFLVPLNSAWDFRDGSFGEDF
jgi:hypothetical protein